MTHFTVIANTTSSVLYLDIGNKATTRLFAELINGNPEADTVKYLQTASQELKDRLHLLDAIGERFYKLKEFFYAIPTGQHFLFLPGRIEDRIQIYLYTKQLAEIDKVPLQSTDLERIASYLYDHYEVRTFNGEERLNIGVFDRTKRICRFCGRSMPEVKFKQKAHAISESLGNKGLVCLEECDDCNTPSNIKLTSLAYVIILAMGWEESHLSMFKKWRKEYHVYMDGADMYDYKEMLKVIKEDPDSEEAWEYYTWLGSKWNEKFFPAIDIAIALNELNYKM